MAADYRNPIYCRSESTPAVNKPSVSNIRSRFESADSGSLQAPVFGLDYTPKTKSNSTPVTPTANKTILASESNKSNGLHLTDKINNNTTKSYHPVSPFNKVESTVKVVVTPARTDNKPSLRPKSTPVTNKTIISLDQHAKINKKPNSLPLDKTTTQNSTNANTSSSEVKKLKPFKPNLSSGPTDVSQVTLRPVSKSDDTKAGYPLSKSSSRSSSTSLSGSIHEGSEPDYMNESYQSRGLRRNNSKPPQNMVQRRTLIFEKSIDEINSNSEEAEAYNKMKELGTVFKPKHPSPTCSQRNSRSASVSSCDSQKPAVKRRDAVKNTTNNVVNNEVKKIATNPSLSGDKNNKIDRFVEKLELVDRFERLAKAKQPNHDPVTSLLEETSTKLTSSVKPSQLSVKPQINNHQSAELIKKSELPQKPIEMITPPAPPPQSAKPGRMETEVIPVHMRPGNKKSADSKFSVHNLDLLDKLKETKFLEPSPPSTMMKSQHKTPIGMTQPMIAAPPPKPPRTFDHKSDVDDDFDPMLIRRQAGDGEEVVSSSSSDSRTYTLTISSENRPYAALVLGGSSGGEDSCYSESSVYDTLGRASIASSYDHYDTISQSELDSDVSRPPTLPRRPSHLRHRPVSTQFSQLELSSAIKARALQNEEFTTTSHPLPAATNTPTIKETSPTTPSPTKARHPFKLKYLLPKALRKAEEMKKVSSMHDLLTNNLYDDVQSVKSGDVNVGVVSPVRVDEAGYAQPEIQKKHSEPRTPTEGHKVITDKSRQAEKIRLKLNQAFAQLRRPPGVSSTQASDGEEEERPPDPETLDERLKHCNSVKEHAIYASAEQIRGFMNRIYAQLYDYAVIVSLRKNPEKNVYEPYCKYKFPSTVNVEQTPVPQFCFPDAHIWHKCTEYKSEAFSFVLTDVTGTRQYGYCRRVLPPDSNNLPRTAEVLCIVSPLNATKLYNQVLDEVEKRRMQSEIRAEEFLQAVYGRPLPSPGQSVIIRAMNQYEEAESFMFTRSPDAQRDGIEYESLLNHLSVSQVVKIFACILLERKIIFVADKLNTLSACVHAFVSLIYPFSWQHTFVPLLPPNLMDIVCAPTPYIIGIMSTSIHLLNDLGDEIDEVLIVDLDNSKFNQRFGDEKTILPKKLHRSLVTALDMAKSEGSVIRNQMIAEAFLRFFLETVGCFNDYLIRPTATTRQFMKEEFVCNAANAPSIMVFLQWFVETQMFSVYVTEKENETAIINAEEQQRTFDERVIDFKSENHDDYFNDNKKFKKLGKLFGKKGKK